MSRRDDSNLFKAGGLAAGVGVLFGLGYAAYEFYKASKQPRRNTNRTSGLENDCFICLENLDSEATVTLGCGHEAHKKCLEANYVYRSHVNHGQTYTCRYRDCRRPLTDAELRSLR